MSRSRAIPRFELLEERALLDGASSSSTAMLTVLSPRPLAAAPVAAAEVPRSYWIFTREAAIDQPRGQVSVEIPLTDNRVKPAHGDRTLYEIRIVPTDGSQFRPGALRLVGSNGRPAPLLTSVRSGQGIDAIVSLAPGTYTAKVSAQRHSTGSFLVQVHLAGDVNGDRKVNQSDLNALLDARAGLRGRAGAVPPTLDVSRDGRLNAADLRLTRRNLDASGLTIQYAFLTATTNGGSPPAVHVALYGINNAGAIIYYDITGTQLSVQANYTTFPTITTQGKTSYYVPNFLAPAAPNGIEIPISDVINAGEILVGVGADVVARVGLSSNGQVTGISQPSTANVSDPNNQTFYQLAEVTQNYPQNSNNFFVNTDISQVDQFGFPLTMQISPNDIKSPDGSGVVLTRTSVISEFLAGASATKLWNAFELCLGRDGNAPDPTNPSAKVPLRILGPTDILSLPPPTGKQQLEHYYDLNTYFDETINGFFTTYQSKPLVLYQGATYTKYTGTVKQISDTDSTGKSHMYWVMQFTGGNSEVYNVYYPFFSTNTPLRDKNKTLYGNNTPPPVPAWWTLPTNESPSNMVFSCNGVFIVSYLPPQYPNDSAIVLANLENQIASAFNRGVATSEITQIGSIPISTTPNNEGLYVATATVQDNSKLAVGMNIRGPSANGPLTIQSKVKNSTTEIVVQSYTPIYPTGTAPLVFAKYYGPGSVSNYYAGLLHKLGISIDTLAYGYAFDDQGGTSTDISNTIALDDSTASVVFNIGLF